MAAPTFVNAGVGVVEVGAAASTVTSGVGSIGDLLILQIFRDGVTDVPSLTLHSEVENLAGTANALSSLASNTVGSTGWQYLWVGRALSTAAATVDLATAGDDLFARWYRFSGASVGTLAATLIENSTGTHVAAEGTGTLITDTGVITLAADRLACNFIAVNDDTAISDFAGESGGDWVLADPAFVSPTGTDGAIALQIASIAVAGTIDGGSVTITPSAGWGVTGFAILPGPPPPPPARPPYHKRMPQLLAQ